VVGRNELRPNDNAMILRQPVVIPAGTVLCLYETEPNQPKNNYGAILQLNAGITVALVCTLDHTNPVIHELFMEIR
jgi:hypothetical protein